jgi:hypothetical protein
MNAQQARTLRRLISRRVRAERDHVWRGAQELAARHEIEVEYRLAIDRLDKFINSITTKETP